MGLAKVGKRGSLVLPSYEREKADIKEGDRVEVVAQGKGVVLMKKVPSLKDVRKKLSGKLSQWEKLEGSADKLLEKETA